MVPHQAVGVAEPAEAADDAAELLEPVAPIGVEAVDRPALVAARGHVVVRAGKLDPERPRHAAELAVLHVESLRRIDHNSRAVQDVTRSGPRAGTADV